MTFRAYWKVAGGHTHIVVFTGRKGFTLGKAGELVMTNEEFEAWKQHGGLVEFVEDRG
jgi:hypothetical protein